MYATNGTMSGSGTAADPFQVADYADLKVVGTTTKYTLSAVYRLAADIDASASATENSDSGFVPIGTLYLSFVGTFHGGGHVIKNLMINRPQTNYIGLFGYSDGTIDSVGVAGGSISGNNFVGGLVGYIHSGMVSYCYATSSAAGNYLTGGLIGYIYGGVVSYCYATGSVSAYGSIGGLAGQNNGLVSNSYATGSVSGSTSIGGLIGVNYDTVRYCYATGSVSGDNYDFGGLVGVNDHGTVIYCYATGLVSGNENTGGLIATNNGNVDTCYWNTETTELTTDIGTNTGINTDTGLTTAQMKKPSSFIGWSFSSTWIIRTDSTYPGLRGIDNAPFAFADSMKSGRTFTLSKLLQNDYDIETAQKNLILRVQSATIGTAINISTLIFPIRTASGYIDTIKYRVGEIRFAQNDTLWGNITTAIITLDTTITGVQSEQAVLPKIFKLNQNYPNPFNPNTTISFDLPKESFVTLKVYDISGREVATLINAAMTVGTHSTVWNASKFTSGIYFYKLSTDSYIATKKLVLLK
jgi:hypothetical protein